MTDATAYGYLTVKVGKMREPIQLTFIDYEEFYAARLALCSKYGRDCIVTDYWGYSIHTAAKALEDVEFWAR